MPGLPPKDLVSGCVCVGAILGCEGPVPECWGTNSWVWGTSTWALGGQYLNVGLLQMMGPGGEEVLTHLLVKIASIGNEGS